MIDLNLQTLLYQPFQQFLIQNQQQREAIFERFRAFYDKDYYEIRDIIKSEMLGKPFRQETIDKMHIIHIDIIQKAIKRQISGIYSQRPMRKLSDGGDNEDTNLETSLNKSHYPQQIKNAVKRAKYFNTIALYFTYRNNQLDIDVLSPESFRVLPNEKDYLKADGIVMRRVNAATNEIYAEVWTLEENYLITAGNKEVAGTNEEMINPYRLNGEPILPVVFLRMEDGLDFYGEPNWNLYNNQIAVDIKLSDNDYAEYFQKFKIPYGIDTGIEGVLPMDPGILLKGQSNGDQKPQFGILDFQIDFASLNKSIYERIKMVLMSEGLPESSSSISNNAPRQVGAKAIDEQELKEDREELKEIYYNFEMDALEVFRAVNNYHTTTPGNKLKKLNESYKFSVEFSEESPTESIDDKTKRREYDKIFLGKDEIDFIMEDLELNEQQALEFIKVRDDRKQSQIILPVKNTMPLQMTPQQMTTQTANAQVMSTGKNGQ